ncbi:enolase C-terminal domain-like protein [Edaphobacter albus]|uniref:enolase C-terminal domain-like protein n=1 Tax=Edaphobacter sp. 4G125 TaxID=2763071 RepID=UPI001644ABEE|nr:enolase C-terminal domain-like protein [Edaphobacter sp. 4G125]QNI38187.1 mandelate racemase [Edaphobacter sp. 4G125]
MQIKTIFAEDRRFPLEPGAGSDAVHSNPVYSFAVTQLTLDTGVTGTGIVLTMGRGNELVCNAIGLLSLQLVGRDIEELMSDFGLTFRLLADDPQLRWLGPHKGVVHLALASITNACFDAWAKARQVPLWKLLLSLSPDEIVALLDLSYLEDVLDTRRATELLTTQMSSRSEREDVLAAGYPGYDTSVGWYQYSSMQMEDRVRRSVDAGFNAFKLKVGGSLEHDLVRARGLRKVVGDQATLMFDANQQWSYPQALIACKELATLNPLWIEEPTHPDDVFAHKSLANAAAPIALALGEHVPNRVIFKNFLQAECAKFLQPDCTRLGGVSEFLTVSLLARIFGVPVVPHVGDMGQIHQHLVLFNHVALGHPKTFLEYIPHLSTHFVHPAVVKDGRYQTPQEAGSSSDLV